ncbi:Eco57I restriction-modification methylase domain-containing protein [Leuconostoc sp. LN180020]|uniref:Eco57I restriction-modification methylase domain-containing protein n=1 Tax=Leuconostoc sp. LN180020 TaxID=2571156 RepID=UPI001FAB44A9|nr:Eco57I restriction-modification methylase domain-containing protein [Leuconostoc sp. LN180020]
MLDDQLQHHKKKLNALKHLTSGRKNSLRQLLSVFSHGDSLGSIIEINPAIDFKELQKLTKSNLLINEDGFDAIEAGKMQQTLRNMLPVAKILSSRFTIAITNPPYMQASKMPKDLKAYVISNYVDSKSDLFAVFIERLAKFVGSNGLYAMITQHQWMFLSSFERLRNKINKQSIINMAHLGTKAFEEIGGEVVQTTAFVMQNTQMSDYVGAFVRLVDYDSQKKKQVAYLNAVNSTESKNVYRTNQSIFKKIPEHRISYWLSNNLIKSFDVLPPLGTYFGGGNGITTGNNAHYLRYWFELNNLDTKWVPYNKGGKYRKWYGNILDYLYWGDEGRELISDSHSVMRNSDYYFKIGLTWSKISSGKIAIRQLNSGSLFDVAGMSLFDKTDSKTLSKAMGFLNSNTALAIIEGMSQTLNFESGTIKSLPFDPKKVPDQVDILVDSNIFISKHDWDSFETSADFSVHPFVMHIDEHNRNWNIIPILNHCNVPNLSQKIFLEVNYG